MSDHRIRQPRLIFLIGLLVLSFVFTAMLAYQANTSARRHQETAERTMQDYAAFSAYEYGVYVSDMISTEVAQMLFVPADLGVGTPPMPRRMPWASDSGEEHAPCVGSRIDSGAFYFRIDVVTREMPLSRGCASSALREWLRDTV